MRRFRRVVSALLFLCVVLSMLPPMQFTRAAEVHQRYELDTDGIDVGATYLILGSGSTGTQYAFKFYYASNHNRSFQKQAVTVQADNEGKLYVNTGFTSEADCQFQFTSDRRGMITHGDYSVDLYSSVFVTGISSRTLNFAQNTSAGSGAYRISYTSGWSTYYLRYQSNKWQRSTSSSSNVYLYKLVEYETTYNVRFDGNGYTSGTLPQDKEKIEKDTVYTVPYPISDLRKDIGEDTWLFRCWNTSPDGSGTEYMPGETITITEDVTLYAEWYQQTKHTISMITYLDDVATDVDKFAGYDRHFYAVLEGGDGTYIQLTHAAEGTYSAKVTENGNYIIYAQTIDGRYEPVHGHKVVVYNGDGSTECLHYSITYDAAGGVWAEGEDPGVDKCHNGETVLASEKVPTKEGYRFLGWQDQDNNIYAAGQQIPAAINKKLTLTALWEETINVTVNITLNHNSGDGGQNPDDEGMHEVVLSLLQYTDGANLPLENITFNDSTGYDESNGITTYSYTFTGLAKGHYHATASKPHYALEITHSGEHDSNQTIDLVLTYTPSSFELDFDVVVDDRYEGLDPQAVNIKVLYWDEVDGVPGWYTITQQAGSTGVPVTVPITDGHGTGSYPVWKYQSDLSGNIPYDYRIEVVSFVLPDGSIVLSEGGPETYAPVGSGLYSATVSVVADEEGTTGKKPTYPSAGALYGVYYDGSADEQNGSLQVNISVNPYTVTFDATEDGTVNGQQTITLENQFRHPALHDYVAVPNDTSCSFVCWTDENGNPVENLENVLLTGNVTYYAQYSGKFAIHGTVQVDAKYELDGQDVPVYEKDRARAPVIVLQKKVGDVFNDVDSCVATLTYEKNENSQYIHGVGTYEFTGLPNDGTEYRIQVLTLNYNSAYDNNGDKTFTGEEAIVLVDAQTVTAQVDAFLDFAPQSYQQEIRVNATQISKDLRPTGVLAQVLYRDLGDVHNYNVISQHAVSPYGIDMTLNPDNASATAYENVWNAHTNGTPYEYQLQISTVYGNNVTGAYTQEGTAYTDASPFTIIYGPSNNYLKQNLNGNVILDATLVPKEYPVYLDLNLGKDTSTPVYGLEDYMVDDGTGNERYVYVHTWSFTDHFTAYPYREGYVFTGWKSPNTNEVYTEGGVGDIHVGNTLAHEITLTAQWEKLNGTDCTIRYLELNTDKVLQGATAVSGAVAGDKVVAVEKAQAIKGYIYAGAFIGGTYYDKTENPTMTVTNDPKQNLMVIYYLPDGSDGYTEQVESNLSINKTAVLENDGTYTITMDTFTKDNPITTRIQQNTPLDIVLVLDQSGSMYTGNVLGDLRSSAENFISLITEHGRKNEVDHRLAIVGYGSDAYGGYTSYSYPTAGKDGNMWVNTGVFDSNGDFHIYPVTGFNYTAYTGLITPDGTYYTYADGEYLLLTYHEQYRHLITEEQARVENLNGTAIYGYADGQFVELTRNSSGLWLYGDKLLYSNKEFFTYHSNVWTHRHGLEPREIHAYGLGADYREVGEHVGVFTRTETREADPQKSVYADALVPVSVGAYGSGSTNPGLIKATQNIGANGLTYVSYGIEMANSIFEANPVDPQEGRVRIMVVFTDGKPGDGSNFNEEEANKAIGLSYITQHNYGADVYTIGLYSDDVVAAESDQDFFMNGLSSNYPDAQSIDDVWQGVSYQPAASNYRLNLGGPYYVYDNGKYYALAGKSVYENRTYYTQWGYTNDSGAYVSIYKGAVADGHPIITNNKVGDYTIYRKYGNGYQSTNTSGYFAVANSSTDLKEYFSRVMHDITTKITTEIILHNDTILRDIMGQGLVLTDDTVITVYTQEGNYDLDTGKINWSVDKNGAPILQPMVELNIGSGAQRMDPERGVVVYAKAQKDGVDEKDGVAIYAYNTQAENATDPNDSQRTYMPHTVDITGYDFKNWYISETHTKGYKMVVTITRVEAMDNVKWGRSVMTNNEQSGLWLPADEQGNRQLLLPFDQPTTIFVERAYVLDYGKEFTLSGWYFDDEQGKDATPVHVDCDITNGMNWFDSKNPNTANAKGSDYGNTAYGNVAVKDGKVTYTPTSMNWGGYDQFYVFGDTWRKTVLAQDANENGNLWNKVTVIPANNIYYEDSFITTESDTQNGIEGFTFTGAWSVVGTDDGNTESPEHIETAPYGDVHGWTDSLGNDVTYTDGTAHVTGLNKEMGAKAEFTFTGTGVEVYTRTNAKSGMVVAVLNRIVKDGEGNESTVLHKSIAMDNLAMSGDYYHIPTVTFKDLPYGTYTLQLIATVASTATAEKRYEYYIDGVRIHNPLGNSATYQSQIVKDAYDLETNAVFTEVRDILLQYKDFNTDMSDSTDGKMGAVFIDWILDGQGSGNDATGTGVPTYEIGTFKTYGPKNEVYLSAGQAIVLKVAEGNNYYVGLKSLTGKTVKANISGINQADPTSIEISHTTDMYYRVMPVNGYIVIQNGNTDGALLSITNLRTTNLTAPAENGGILPVAQQEAVTMMAEFSAYMLEKQNEPEDIPEPSEPEEKLPSAQEQADKNLLMANTLFTSVRQWLETD